MSDESASMISNPSHQSGSQIQQQAKKTKRIRERQISEVVKAVAIWRRLYTGVSTTHGDETLLIRYSLTDAAQKVGISRKTLDEYLHLINMGRKYGFKFSARQDEKVGQLRLFVSKAKT